MSRKRIVGLLGGSFNPAHGGHLHISNHALSALGIDEVWWLVSPHNPLKEKNTLADYESRMQSARDITAGQRRIRVSDVEARQHLRYTYETVSELKRRFPHLHFVWLMGADNLAQFHRWRRWRWLLATIPIIVFDRAPYSHTSLRSKTYLRMEKFLSKNNKITCGVTAPSLHIVHLRRDPHSSTAIRNSLGK